ncbi:hypothetical protein TNCV_1319601 [Trichonephila clavipes]|nr:hypothetical protein TNCV_1319601 [Trichonephila clavipes]
MWVRRGSTDLMAGKVVFLHGLLSPIRVVDLTISPIECMWNVIDRCLFDLPQASIERAILEVWLNAYSRPSLGASPSARLFNYASERSCLHHPKWGLLPTDYSVNSSDTNLRNKINSFPPKIIWRYGIYPKLFDKMSDIEFHEGMPFDVEDITNAFVIIDDLMNEVGDDKRTFKLVHERKPS